MNKKLKIALSTTIGLILASIIPLSIISPIRSNNTITSLNKNMEVQSDNVQRVNSIDDIVFSSSIFASSMFAIITDVVNGDRLYAWGNNGYGQLGLGTSGNNISVPTLVNIPDYRKEHRITAITTGHSSQSATALVINNELYLCGTDNYGQQGNGNISGNITTFTKLDHDWGGTIKQILIGGDFVILVTNTSKLWGWGHGTYQELMGGVNKYTPQLLKEQINGENISKVGTGVNFGWILTASNQLYMWGHDVYGQQGNGSGGNQTEPTKLDLPGNISQIWAGYDTMYAVLDNTLLYGWGYRSRGELGMPGNTSGGSGIRQETPMEIAVGSDMKIINVNRSQIIISHSGSVFGTGENGSGALGIGHGTNVTKFTELTYPGIDMNKLNM